MFEPANNHLFYVYFTLETPESILIKVGIAKRYGLAGIAIWRLGLVTGEMWDALRANVIPW
jgi:spore germination protein YaaH